jgi:hypothetical protein
MKRFLIMAMVLILAGLVGCGKKSNSKAANIENKNVVKTGDVKEVKDQSKQPIFAGVWAAIDSPWKIVIMADGNVASAVIPIGEVEIQPNETKKVEMKDGSFGAWEAGAFDASYQPETQTLSVSIEMKHILVPFPDDKIEGDTFDFFTGKISADGKVWTTEHTEIFNYGSRFPQAPEDTVPAPLVFKKVEEKQKAEVKK